MTGQPWWNHHDPGRCDVTQVHAFATLQARRRDQIESVRKQVVGVVSGLAPGVMQGIAAEAWRVATDSVVPGYVSMVGATLDGAEAAIRTYQGVVEEVQAHAARATNELAEAEHRIRNLTPPDPNQPVAQEDQRQLALAQEAREQAMMSLNHTAARRTSADASLMSVLGQVPDMPGFPAETLMYVGAQVAAGSFEDGVEVGLKVIRAAEATRALNESFYRNSPEHLEARGPLGIEARSAILALGDDEAVLSAYFDTLGGEELVTLCHYGPADAADLPPGSPHEARMDVAVIARDKLAIASPGWDREMSDEFAQEMVDGARNDSKLDIGFFFADAENAQMGANLTVSMADLMDDAERGSGGDDESWGLYDPGFDPGLGYFREGAEGRSWDLEDGSEATAGGAESFSNGQYTDASAMILRTLGSHPDAALDWMLDGPEGTGGDGTTARIEYWFGERDSSRSGFLGPIVLLEGTQHAEGGYLDPDQEFDRVTMERQATAFDGAFESLSDDLLSDDDSHNPHFDHKSLSDGPTDAASSKQALARAMGNYAPILAEGAFFHHDEADASHKVVAMVGSGDIPIDPETGQVAEDWGIPVPDLTPYEVANVLRAAADDPAALAIFEQATVGYFADLSVGVSAELVTPLEAGERLAALTALREAVAHGLAEEQWVADADKIERWHGAGSALIGLSRRAGIVSGAVDLAGEVMAEDIRDKAYEDYTVERDASSGHFEGMYAQIVKSSDWHINGDSDLPLYSAEASKEVRDAHVGEVMSTYSTVYHSVDGVENKSRVSE